MRYYLLKERCFINMIKNLGYLLAFPEISTDDFEIYIECGISLLENGCSLDSVCLLAGYSKPYNFFELRKIISDMKEELSFPDLEGSQAVAAYSYRSVEKLASEDNHTDTLNRLSDLCVKNNYAPVIYDFYLLHFALSDLLCYGEPQQYWKGLTPENSAEVIKNAAQNWLKENRHLLDFPSC